MSIFTSVQGQKVRHNTFDLSHERKFSGMMGNLIPVMLEEVVPNDTFTINTQQILRFAPLVAPVMHRFSIYTHFFFVPNRILWNGFEDFINGGNDGEDAPVFPFLQMNDLDFDKTEGGLADYMGLPILANTTGGVPVSAVPFAAYQKIWYEYYRDQNIQNSSAYDFLEREPLDDGDNSALVDEYTTIRKRAWQHDYFTSALPWTQRGPEATIPLGATADLLFDGYDTGPSQVGFLTGTNTTAANSELTGDFTTGTGFSSAAVQLQDGAVQKDVTFNVANSHSVDLSNATAASINDLRRAFRLQEWLELNARGGARYEETVKIHFGISTGDARVNRPEFLGGSSTPIVISEVLQVNSQELPVTSPLGTMGGHGVSVGGRNITKYKCREHGFIIGIMSVMPKTAYQQGIDKFWNKFDKFDYYWKSFANIGEQPIYNKEIYLDNSDGENNDIFGYTPRYAEYKFRNDSVHGEFRTSLDFWHAGRIFAARPNLNEDFITMSNLEVSRIFAVTSGEQFYCQMYHKVKARRPMPYFGTPTI